MRQKGSICMKLGARILKTGVAIVLALYVSELLHLPAPVLAGISAIFAIQPTIYRSYLSVIEQVQGNLIGAAIAVFFVLAFGNNLFIVGLAAILVIILNLKLKLDKTITLSLVTLIAIMVAPEEDFIHFALLRFSSIMLGIGSSFLVNLVFLPPKYESKLFQKNNLLSEEIFKWIRINTRHASEYHLLKGDIEKLSEGVLRLEHLYIMYKEERNYFKKNSLAKARKLVIYRHMNGATTKALDTLKLLHRYENEMVHMPENFQEAIQLQLDYLINYHEQVMLKFLGKIKPGVTPSDGQVCFDKKELFNLFLAQKQKLDDRSDNQALYHMMQLVSVIMDYGEQVEHLDRLVTSIQSYHKDENQVKVEPYTGE